MVSRKRFNTLWIPKICALQLFSLSLHIFYCIFLNEYLLKLLNENKNPFQDYLWKDGLTSLQIYKSTKLVNESRQRPDEVVRDGVPSVYGVAVFDKDAQPKGEVQQAMTINNKIPVQTPVQLYLCKYTSGPAVCHFVGIWTHAVNGLIVTEYHSLLQIACFNFNMKSKMKNLYEYLYKYHHYLYTGWPHQLG